MNIFPKQGPPGVGGETTGEGSALGHVFWSARETNSKPLFVLAQDSIPTAEKPFCCFSIQPQGWAGCGKRGVGAVGRERSLRLVLGFRDRFPTWWTYPARFVMA